MISIGAGAGGDSLAIRNLLFPQAKALLIEAQAEHATALHRLCQTNKRIEYVMCVAAGQDGSSAFLASSPTGGAAVSEGAVGAETLPARAVDSLVAERGWNGPFMLKLDTHGTEMDIFAGATSTLSRAALVMVECYNFKLNFVGGKNLLFYEMCRFMEDRGLRCVDLCDPLWRPNDQVLWQIHLFFIPQNHPVFASNSYSAPSPF
jgi:FkbM family methyltransferase